MVGGTLALDLGTVTGWALWTGHDMLGGTWNFSPRRGDGAGMRFLRLRHALDEMSRIQGPFRRLVYELPAGTYKSGAADDVIKGMVAHTQSWAEGNGVPYEGVSPTTIKKYAVGKGNAKKDLVFARAKELWPETSDHNEGDARLLLQMVLDGRL
jgi:hypothetical protein